MQRKRAWMYLWLRTLVITVALLTPGCEDAGEDGSVSVPEISLDSLSFDFGIVEAEGGSDTRTFTVTNEGETSVTVSGVTLSDTTHYSTETGTLPLTLSVGDTTTVRCSFSPQDSGVFSA